MPDRSDYALSLDATRRVTVFNNGFLANLPSLQVLFYGRPVTGNNDLVAAMGGPEMFSEFTTPKADPDELETGEGYSKTFTLATYFAGYTWDKDVWDDMPDDIKRHHSEQLGRAAAYTQQYLMAAHIIGLASTSLGGDGLALAHAAHTLKFGGTASNTSNVALAYDSYFTARAALTQCVDDRGQIVPRSGRFLVHPPQKTQIARQMTASDVTSAAMQANVMRGEVAAIEFPWAIDTDDWFVAPDPAEGGPFMRLLRSAPDYVEGDDPRTREHYMNSRFREVVGGVDWRGLYYMGV